MDERETDVGSTPAPGVPVEGWMLREDVVREVLARLARGEQVKAIARELGIDKKTIKRWRQRGAWRPRAPRVYSKAIDAHRPFLERRGPEVGWNGVVLLRESRAQGFTGGYQQVQRALQPLRSTRQWAARATVRFETGPGEQAQVDFGQLSVWITDVETPVHFFVRDHHDEPGLRRVGQCFCRREDDDGLARPPDPSLPHRRDGQRLLSFPSQQPHGQGPHQIARAGPAQIA